MYYFLINRCKANKRVGESSYIDISSFDIAVQLLKRLTWDPVLPVSERRTLPARRLIGWAGKSVWNAGHLLNDQNGANLMSQSLDCRLTGVWVPTSVSQPCGGHGEPLTERATNARKLRDVAGISGSCHSITWACYTRFYNFGQLRDDSRSHFVKTMCRHQVLCEGLGEKGRKRDFLRKIEMFVRRAYRSAFKRAINGLMCKLR